MANQEHENLIHQKQRAWNDWRKENPNIKPDLSGADLRNENLRGFILDNVNLSKAMLSQSLLNQAILNGANLDEAELKWAELTSSNLIGATLNRANLVETNLQDANLTDAILCNSNLYMARLIQTNLSNTNLENAILNNCNLQSANLINANLTNAKLQNTNMTNAKLSKANLERADLSNAKLNDVNMKNATVAGANFNGINFHNADLRGIDFTKARLTNANFTRAIADEHQFASGQLSDGQRKQLGFPTVASGDDKPPSDPPVITASETPDEPDEFKVIDLRVAFEKYLIGNKGYTSKNFSTEDNSDGYSVTHVLDAESNKRLAVIQFGLEENFPPIKKAWDHFIKLEYVDIDGYLVLPGESSLGEEFNILKFSEHANKYSHISIDVFPAYEELKRKPIEKVAKKKAAKKVAKKKVRDEYSFRTAFKNFLEGKGYSDKLNQESVIESQVFDLVVSHPEVDSPMAIFVVSPFKDDSLPDTAKRAHEIFVRTMKVGFVGIYNPFVYIVTPSVYPEDDFDILEYDSDGGSNQVLEIDFPVYKQMLFASPLNGAGRRLCQRLIKFANREYGFILDTPSPDYINLKLSRTGRTAAQLHRLNGLEIELALVLPGYQEEFPDMKKDHLTHRANSEEIKLLSGYFDKPSGQKNWLDGNRPDVGIKYKAGIYVINQIAAVPNSIWNGIDSLLQLAKKNAENKGVDEHEVKPDEDIASEMFSIGSGCDIRRKASPDERCLDVHSYANVLSTFFKKAKGDGEFCFGLFGHWGRGKTYLMEMVKDELEDDNDCPYEIIFFSAWKYRTTPEAWIHLYETFAKHLTDTKNWFSLLPSLVRAGIIRYGFWGIIISILIFGISILSLGEKVKEVLLPLYSVIGIAGIFLCVRMYFGFRRIGSTLRRYITLSRHGDKLGLQELIGKDLKSLIIGWIPLNKFKIQFSLLSCFYLIAAGWVAFVLFPDKPQELTAWRDLVKYLPYTFSYLVFLLWLVVVICGALYVVLGGRKTKQILLVIDDLDRCRPEQMLEIMESLKLLLEDKEIHERIQVVMLVDEEMLRHAIERKFEAFIKSKNTKAVEDNSKDVLNQIAHEHIEKLFACYLRLPELSHDEVSEVTKKYLELSGSIREPIRISPTESPDNDKSENGTEEPLAVGTQEIPTQDEKSAKKKPIAPKETREVSIEDALFSRPERERLALAIPLMTQSDKSRKWGPRSIRALLFKYQLSRLLLTALNVKFTPTEIIDKLCAIAAGVDSVDAQLGVSKDVKRVLEQVK